MIGQLFYVLNRGEWQAIKLEGADPIDALFDCANYLICEACDGGYDEDLDILEALQGAQSYDVILKQVNEILADYDCEICTA